MGYRKKRKRRTKKKGGGGGEKCFFPHEFKFRLEMGGAVIKKSTFI